jgi:hypothetical protein
MANLLDYISVKFTRMNGEILKDLGDQIDKVARLQTMLQSLKNPDMLVEGGSLTLDRIQIMEDGSPRILPMPEWPLDTCIEEVSREFGKKNGKKESKEAENAVEQVTSLAVD